MDDGTSSWVSCLNNTTGAKPDSRVHRFARQVGFLSTEKDNDDIENNAMVAEASRQMACDVGDLVVNRVEAQSIFECFVLARGEDTAYYRFLNTISSCFDTNGNLREDVEVPRIKFDPPTMALLEAFILFLRTGRDLSYGGIHPVLSGLSSVNGQFAGHSISRTKMKPLLDKWKQDDKENGRTRQAQVFSVVDDQPILFRAVFAVKKWTKFFSVMIWTMFLVMACVLGRASCMTKFSPLIENIEFPEGSGGYDTDGFVSTNLIVILSRQEYRVATLARARGKQQSE